MDWGNFFTVLFAALGGALGTRALQWYKDNDLFLYKWSCQRDECSLRLQFSNRAILTKVIDDHNARFHPQEK